MLLRASAPIRWFPGTVSLFRPFICINAKDGQAQGNQEIKACHGNPQQCPLWFVTRHHIGIQDGVQQFLAGGPGIKRDSTGGKALPPFLFDADMEKCDGGIKKQESGNNN